MVLLLSLLSAVTDREHPFWYFGVIGVLVSAGLDVYLDPWCSAHGVEVICTQLEERNGRMTGRYRRGDCSGPTIYAYGDTVEDREMLALANRMFYRWKEVDDGDKAG